MPAAQDIILHSRVLDYKPEYLYQVGIRRRQFFDYGGWLAMYPMQELPVLALSHGTARARRST